MKKFILFTLLSCIGFFGFSQRYENPDKKKTFDWFVGSASSGPVITYDSLISGYDLSPVNAYVDVAFDFGVFNSGGGEVLASDLAIIFHQNGGTATGVTIDSLTSIDTNPLTGGENIIRVYISITGLASGIETIEVTPSAQGTIIDDRGFYIIGGDTTGEIELYYSYGSAWLAVLNYAIENDIPIPDENHNIIASEKTDSLVSEGIFTEWDAAYPLFLCMNKNFAMINIVNPGVNNATESGSPSWTVHEGVRSGGGGYVNSNFTPSTDGVKYTLNSASIWAYFYNNAQANGIVTTGVRGDGGANANYGHSAIGGLRNDEAIGTTINRNSASASNTATGLIFDISGLLVANRLTSTSNKIYHRGVQVSSNAGASASPLSSLPFYISSLNANGTASSFNTINDISFIAYGSDLDTKMSIGSDIITNWINATDTLPVTPTPPTPGPGGVNRLYQYIGQSNADGRGLVSSLPAYLTGPLTNCYIWNRTSQNWDELNVLLNGNNAYSGQRHGSLIALAYEQRALYPNDILYFINSAWGGTTLANQWAYNTGFYYLQAIDDFDNVIATGTTFTKHALIWWQGEGDTGDLTFANAYEANEDATITGFQTHTAFNNTICINISGNTTDLPYVDIVRTAKENNALNGLYTLIDSLPYNPSLLVHVQSAGLVSIGEDISAILP